ncbi:hypothetical protein [Deinococcus multiflagellatus]|uniref:Uncharacterized protein n=1 Tax=Deinococcus multiflagellatus TaxID=1656887 RepID=A0ABW1ZLE0_9DEIO
MLTASPRTSKPRLLLPLVAGALLVGAATGAYLLTRPPAQRGDDSKSIAIATSQLAADFEQSRQTVPRHEGQQLARLNFPVSPGFKAPDWTRPMLLTFGTEFAPQVKALHGVLKGRIQLVHVVYHPVNEFNTPAADRQLQEFDRSVALLDTTQPDTPDPQPLLDQAGIHRAGYAFLLDDQQKILYSSNTIGLGTEDVVRAVNAYVQGGAGAVRPNPEQPLTPGESLLGRAKSINLPPCS